MKNLANRMLDKLARLVDDPALGKGMPSSSDHPGRKALAVLTLAHLVNHVFVEMHLALIPVFMTEFNIDILAASFIVAIPLAFQFLMTIPSGIFSDRIGGDQLIWVSLLVTAAGAALASQASNAHIVIVSLCLLALGTTLYHPPAYSAVSNVFPVERRSTALGIHGAGGTLGVALGPISMGFLLSPLGWRLTYLAWMFPALAGAFLCWKLRPFGKKSNDRGVQEEHAQDPAPHQKIASVLTVGFLVLLAVIAAESIGGRIISTFLSPYLVLEMKIPVHMASIILGVVSLMGIVAAPSGGVLADKLGERRWIGISYVGMMLSIGGIAFARSTTTLVLFVAAYGYFTYSGMGARTSLVARFTPLAKRGVAYAFYFLPVYGASSVASIIGASIAKEFQIWSIFPSAAAMIFLALVSLRLIPMKKTQT